MRKHLPVWLLGWSNLPLGVTGAVALIVAPQVLAAQHVPEPRIAQITALGLLASFAFLPIAPLLDVWLSRRAYAAGLSILTAALTAVSVLSFHKPETLGGWLFLAMLSAQLNTAAVGGWFGSALPKESDAALGAWFTIANIAGGGLTALGASALLARAPTPLAALMLGAINLLPLLIYLGAPGPAGDRMRLGERFGRFAGDLAALSRNVQVIRTMVLFAVPAASFALTNTLGGLGGDYHAGAAFVGMVAGAGVTVAGVIGSLIVPQLARRVPLRPLYLGIGMAGACSTLSLIVLPRTPAVFGAAFIAQNNFQAAAFATANGVILAGIGKDSPVAATQFGVLAAALCLPIAYMQLLDGHSYGAGGLTVLYGVDGGLGLTACALLAVLLRRWARAPRLEEKVAPALA